MNEVAELSRLETADLATRKRCSETISWGVNYQRDAEPPIQREREQLLQSQVQSLLVVVAMAASRRRGAKPRALEPRR